MARGAGLFLLTQRFTGNKKERMNDQPLFFIWKIEKIT